MNETFYLDKPVYLRYFYWLGVMQAEPSPETKMQQKQEDEDRAALNLPPKSHARGILHGDFGYSMETHSVTVWERLRDAVPITILLNVITFFVIYLVAIPIGIYSATHPYTLLDRITTIGAFMLFSLPSFWVALMMILFMVRIPPEWRLPFNGLEPVGAERLSTLNYFGECAKHLVLPIIVMSYGGIAGLSRYMRSGDDRGDPRRLHSHRARERACPEFIVIYKHALRNSLIPVITILGGELPAMLSGSVILESIFGIRGMGYLAYHALLARDYTVLMADLSIGAVLVMAGFLASDMLYLLVDPRIRFD